MKEKLELFGIKVMTLLFVLVIWATTINFSQRDLKDKTTWQKIGLYLLDLIYAGFFGVVGYFLSYDFLNVSTYGAAAIGGIMAHKGANLIYLLEKEIVNKVTKKL